ncbi:MAG: DNA ligase D [Phycisphaerales bacterium]|nr:DNA ligase D [Phycisphaerales bacterium]
MGLREYRSKRNFGRTPEPAPTRGRAGERTFVVQKHYATSAHYDLRLRVGDVLKSWAVPKGPSLDPRDKRLAVEVEDHPVGYASFEGVIPEGQYGAGTVMVWDEGRWSPIGGDPAKSLRDGELKFNLEGHRLKGRWVLVRTSRPARQPQWLLIKEKDREASAGVHAETFGTSVTTGRTMDEIAAGAPVVARPTPPERVSAASLMGARAAKMPAGIKPQLAVAAERAPEGEEWLHEVKFDGYRLLVFRRGERVTVLSRGGLDWTAKVPGIVAAVKERLGVDAVLDGEAVLLDTRGVSDFQALQNAIHMGRSPSIVYMAFDLPWCDGFDLTGSPLERRRALLADLIGPRQDGRLRYSEHVAGGGAAAFGRACEAGLEGIVSKRRGAAYTQSRAPSWVKVKCFNQQEFVIGGFSAPEGTREQFGALLVGYYEDGGLRFAGKVGSGFSTETLRKLAAQLKTRVRATPPFADPPTGAEARGVTWVRPDLVAQVRFGNWTGDGVIRHPSFRGLRDDVDARAVGRDAVRGPRTGSPARGGTPAPRKRSRVSRTAAPHKAAAGAAAPQFTNLDRVVYPDRGAGYALTKRQVVEYYEAVGPRMLPHVADRPLSILRCPDGEGGKMFFQKHPAKGMPAAVGSVEVPDGRGTMVRHLCIRDLDGLLGLVQMNVLEFHPWGARADAVEAPDRLIFDMDPGAGVSWRQTVDGALMVREALAQAALTGFARVSGGKGVHVVVPLKAGHTWGQARVFCKAAAEAMVRIAARRFVAVPGASNRRGRTFIDYLRNVRGATAIAPYSTRARPGGPVALPVAWDELPGLDSASAFSVPSVLRRLASDPPDPWRGIAASAGTLPSAAAT